MLIKMGKGKRDGVMHSLLSPFAQVLGADDKRQ